MKAAGKWVVDGETRGNERLYKADREHGEKGRGEDTIGTSGSRERTEGQGSQGEGGGVLESLFFGSVEDEATTCWRGDAGFKVNCIAVACTVKLPKNLRT